MLHVGADPLIVVGSKCFSFVENKQKPKRLSFTQMTDTALSILSKGP